MGPSRKKPIEATPPGTLRREIIAALTIKVVLLFGLWLLLFRTGGDRPPASHDIEARLLTASSPDSQVRIRAGTQTNPITVRPLTEEVPHVQ
jgi:hypothetical protein